MGSTRTLDNADDRKITTMIIPFISCGAKAPIYAVFAGALFPDSSYFVVFSMYILGILVAILSALLFKNTIYPCNSLHQVMPFHRLVYIHGMQAGNIKPRKPHIPDNDELEFVLRIFHSVG